MQCADLLKYRGAVYIAAAGSCRCTAMLPGKLLQDPFSHSLDPFQPGRGMRVQGDFVYAEKGQSDEHAAWRAEEREVELSEG